MLGVFWNEKYGAMNNYNDIYDDRDKDGKEDEKQWQQFRFWVRIQWYDLSSNHDAFVLWIRIRNDGTSATEHFVYICWNVL